jgi:hypothetical protein
MDNKAKNCIIKSKTFMSDLMENDTKWYQDKQKCWLENCENHNYRL